MAKILRSHDIRNQRNTIPCQISYVILFKLLTNSKSAKFKNPLKPLKPLVAAIKESEEKCTL